MREDEENRVQDKFLILKKSFAYPPTPKGGILTHSLIVGGLPL